MSFNTVGALLVGSCLLIAALSGCSQTVDRCPARTVVDVPSLPPSPLPESKQKAPAPEMIWVAGAWEWVSENWRWIPGRWLSSPDGARWEPGRAWVDSTGVTHFERGGFGCRE